MNGVFLNYTNHPSDRWEEAQTAAARMYGRIADVPFPAVDPAADEDEIERMAADETAKLLAYGPDAVLCQGEFCLAYQVITRLKQAGVTVLAACSERVVTERAAENGETEVVRFRFRRFRKY